MSGKPLTFHFKSNRISKCLSIPDCRAPVIYILLQLLIAAPVLANCVMQEVSGLLIGIFAISSCVAIYFYFLVACTNPGYIMGSSADVESRAGAYDPKDYQVESERKVTKPVKEHFRKLSFMTNKLKTKPRQDTRTHFELPPLNQYSSNTIEDV
jgi:hypothetical protein